MSVAIMGSSSAVYSSYTHGTNRGHSCQEGIHVLEFTPLSGTLTAGFLRPVILMLQDRNPIVSNCASGQPYFGVNSTIWHPGGIPALNASTGVIANAKWPL